MKICRVCKEPNKQFHRSVYKGKERNITICTDCVKVDRERIKQEKAAGTYTPKPGGKAPLSPADKIRRTNELREYHKGYRERNKEVLAKQKAASLNNARVEGLITYGGKCTCCGESRQEFLTIEHKNGRSKDIRRRTGKSEWLRLKARGWPNDITIHCFNCNCAKGIYGTCPHTWES